jgi:hypothetical protein
MALVERHRLPELVDGRGARRLPFHQLRAGRRVEPVVAGRVELQRVARDVQKRGVCGVVANRLAQVGERVAQVAERLAVRPVGPQQPGQYLAVMRPACFDGQVGQQRADFVGFEPRDRPEWGTWPATVACRPQCWGDFTLSWQSAAAELSSASPAPPVADRPGRFRDGYPAGRTYFRPQTSPFWRSFPASTHHSPSSAITG